MEKRAKRFHPACLVFLLLLLFAAVSQAQQPKAPPRFSVIEGHVFDAKSGAPISKANLLLLRIAASQENADWTNSYAATTDASGHFEFADVTPGRYRLSAKRIAYVPLEYGAGPSNSLGAVLDLEKPQELKGLTLKLLPQVVIAGRVVDPEGEPLEAKIELLRARYLDGKKTAASVTTRMTDDLGQFRFAGLLPGTYYLVADLYSGLPPTGKRRESLVPTFYPAAPDIYAASALVASAGTELQLGDFVLRREALARVSGYLRIEVEGNTSNPRAQLEPELGYDNRNSPARRFLPARTRPDGSFVISGVPSGTYAAVGYTSVGDRTYYGDVPIRIEGVDIEDLVIPIRASASFSGSIRVEGDLPLDPGKLRLEVRSGGPGSAASRPWSASRIADDYTFVVQDLKPANYGISVAGLPPGYYTKRIETASTDVIRSGLNLSLGSAGPVQVLLSPKAAYVAGQALDANGEKPSIGATVVLVPKDAERRAIAAYYHSVRANHQGRYGFANVQPGDYLLYAWENAEETAWHDPAFLKSFEGNGKALSVKEQDSVTLDATVLTVEEAP